MGDTEFIFPYTAEDISNKLDQVDKNKKEINQLQATVNDLKENGVGKTPEKGVDYWTEEDKAEIKSYVDEAILGGEW